VAGLGVNEASFRGRRLTTRPPSGARAQRDRLDGPYAGDASRPSLHTTTPSGPKAEMRLYAEVTGSRATGQLPQLHLRLAQAGLGQPQKPPRRAASSP